MSGFRGVMAADLMVSGVSLSCRTECALALLSAGWKSTHICAYMDDTMSLARAMSVAQDREKIIRDMAQLGDEPAASVDGVSSLNLPGTSVSGPFGERA